MSTSHDPADAAGNSASDTAAQNTVDSATTAGSDTDTTDATQPHQPQAAPQQRSWQHWWQTRPIRPSSSHGITISGVSTAIGYRYDVDPLLIRIVFVATTLMGGIGLVGYLACWLLFRYQDDGLEIHSSLLAADSKRRPLHTLKVASVLCAFFIAVAIMMPSSLAMNTSSVVVSVSALMLIAAAYLLYSRCPEPPRALADLFSAAISTDNYHPYPDSGITTAESSRVPLPYAPLSRFSTDSENSGHGTVHYAWELRPPLSAAEQERRAQRLRQQQFGRRLTLTVLALVGIALIVCHTLAFFDHLSYVRASAIPLFILGLGIVVGSIRRVGYALVPVAMCLAFIVFSTGIIIEGLKPGTAISTHDFGTATIWAPETEKELSTGRSDVLLHDLTITTDSLELHRDAQLPLSAIKSHIQIVPDPRYTIEIHCTKTVQSQCLTQTLPAAKPGSPKITVRAELISSRLEVTQ